MDINSGVATILVGSDFETAAIQIGGSNNVGEVDTLPIADNRCSRWARVDLFDPIQMTDRAPSRVAELGCLRYPARRRSR